MTTALTGAGGALADRRSAKREAYADWALAAACLAGLAMVAVQLGRSPAPGTRPQAEEVAELAFSSSLVRRRAESTLVWEDIATGDRAHQRDTLFVPPGSSAILRFRDGSTLQLEQDSLIVIEAPEKGASKKARQVKVKLQRGSISGKAGSVGMTVSTGSGAARLSAGATARVSLDKRRRMRVSRLSGSASLRTKSGDRKLETGSSALVDGEGRAMEPAAPGVELVEPGYGARVYFHEKTPRVSFAWRDPAKVAASLELAADRDFSERRASLRVKGERVALPLAAEGNTYWRITDAEGKPVSDIGFLVAIEEAPPLISSPGDGEVVSAPGNRPVLLAWTEVTGVTRYLIELGEDPDLGKNPSTFRSDGTRFWWSGDLEEGVYYWRVRADDPERKAAPFSATARFRLITRPLPAAPELLEVEYRF